ncbi:MAG: IS1634 family transposase [Candidatus Methanoperedens sp.]|nr:IS1634 family transposase [Candidatus Methanoperedens sp.]
MVHFHKKKIKGNEYWYLRETQWIDGKSRVIWQKYLGTMEKIKEVFELNEKLPSIKVSSFEYGKTAALLKISEELEFCQCVNQNVTKKDIDGLSVGEYMLLIILGRTNGPLSKQATAEWFNESYLKFQWKFSHELNSQNFLNNMDFITEKTMRQIEEKLAAKLLQNGIKPTTIFWDTTNVFTYIESGDKLPQKGRSKQKRYDKNLVTFGIAESNENIPLMHETCPGNAQDAKLFPEIIDKLVDRLRNLKINTHDMALVFDKGNNSDDNIDKILENMHVIGSVKRNQVKTLMEIPLSEYKFLYKSSKVNEVYGYRTKYQLFGREFTVVVSYNPQSHKKKENKYEENKKRILEELAELKKKAEREHGKGKKITRKGLCTNANKVIPNDLVTIFRYSIPEEGKISFEYWIDKTAEKDFKNSFGKIAVFTDIHNSSSTDIARTYFGKNLVEDDFKFLKDKLLIPVPPFFMRKDGRIRVHVFLCVVGMLFYRYLARKVKFVGLSIKELEHQLDGIRVAFLKDKGTNSRFRRFLTFKASQSKMSTFKIIFSPPKL